MDGTNAPNIFERLTSALPELPEQQRKAATWLLENSASISFGSTRELAERAHVTPNSLVRVAKAVGLSGFEELRDLTRQSLLDGQRGFNPRSSAEWLQQLGRGGKLDCLLADCASASIENLSQMYGTLDSRSVKAAADDIVKARIAYVLGVGVNNSHARNFEYLADMAVENVRAIPRDGMITPDSMARLRADDLLLAMTFKPYRSEVVEAVALARKIGAKVIAISDSPASPIFTDANHRFVIPVAGPQFFTSTVALGAFLETLLAFVIADADPAVLANIEELDARRRSLGVYVE